MAQQPVTPAYPFSLKEELAKNPELKEADLQILREWCNKQPHLPKISDQYLMLFLHSNYYQLEPAKVTIENYFTLRTHVPEYFSNRDPIGLKTLREAFLVSSVIPLTKRTSEGYVLIYAYLLDSEPSRLNYYDSSKITFMIMDLLILKYGPVKGYIFIVDCSKVLLGHLGRVPPLGLKRTVYYVQDAMPIRLKAVHFIHAPSAIDVLYNISKPFMNKELANLVHIHSSMSSVPQFLQEEILPQYDAKTKSELTAKAIKEMEDKREWFLEEGIKHRVNEDLRVGETKSANSLFGVEGSFKKLDID